jgi:putative Mg2+ transporter-C (MgtC) family protein
MMSQWWLTFLESLRHEFGWGLPDPAATVRALLRLSLALVAGGLLGADRERLGKAAGLRTHCLVCVGSALFVLATQETIGNDGHMGTAVQGVAQGIGFLGAGVILKLTDERRVLGLTTAASIWATAAVGTAVGMGHYGVAVVALALAMFVLEVLRFVEREKHPPGPSEPAAHNGDHP